MKQKDGGFIVIDKLRELCRAGHIKWTLHALNRIRERKIASIDVVDAMIQGEVIMYYHDDKPFPSWLIYNQDVFRPLHVVASTDGSKAHIITAYVPNLDEWEADCKTRKE